MKTDYQLEPYSFQRYLESKKSIDDRALNYRVFRTLVEVIPPSARLLEIGAGIGTMLERLLSWGLFESAEYTGIDLQPENIAEALHRLPVWAQDNDYLCQPLGANGYSVTKGKQSVTVHFEAVDVFDFIKQAQRQQSPGWDVLAAHAFLDLVDIPETLPGLLTLLRDGGLCYFTINFDGVTAFEPVIDADLDDLIQTLYHRTMDERIVGDSRSGDSHSGRHLFSHLRSACVEVLQAGPSDWVVWPSQTSPESGKPHYPGDEAYFLHYIIETIQRALQGSPDLAAERLAGWIAKRHEQIERGELVYIAHQLDFLGVKRPQSIGAEKFR